MTIETLDEKVGMQQHSTRMPINQDMLADIKELYESLLYMHAQHGCGCKHNSCNRCSDDKDNAKVILRIESKYQHADGWQD